MPKEITKDVIERLLEKVRGQNNGDVVPLMWVEYWLLDNFGELVPNDYQNKGELKQWILDLIRPEER